MLIDCPRSLYLQLSVHAISPLQSGPPIRAVCLVMGGRNGYLQACARSGRGRLAYFELSSRLGSWTVCEWLRFIKLCICRIVCLTRFWPSVPVNDAVTSLRS